MGTGLWAGNREEWRRLLRPSHPIRWAWSTWERRHGETTEILERGDYAELVVLRLRRPREVRAGTGARAEKAPVGRDESSAGLEGHAAAR